MKIKFHLSFLLIGFFATLASAGQSPKFGYSNSVALLAELPDIKKVDSEIQSLRSSVTIQDEQLKDKYVELLRKQREGKISKEDYEAQSNELQKESARIQGMINELTKKREELYKPILDKVNRAMQKVAKENGYLMIFNRNSKVLLFAEEDRDVTDLIKAELGL